MIHSKVEAFEHNIKNKLLSDGGHKFPVIARAKRDYKKGHTQTSVGSVRVDIADGVYIHATIDGVGNARIHAVVKNEFISTDTIVDALLYDALWGEFSYGGTRDNIRFSTGGNRWSINTVSKLANVIVTALTDAGYYQAEYELTPEEAVEPTPPQLTPKQLCDYTTLEILAEAQKRLAAYSVVIKEA